MFRVLLSALVILACAPAAALHAEVQRVNCDHPHQRAYQVAPDRTGPLSLAAIYCQSFPDFASFAPPVVSPDAASIFFVDTDGILQTSRLDQRQNWIAHDRATSIQVLRSADPFAWRADGAGLWGVRENRMRPRGGWTVGPIETVNISGAEIATLPQASHRSGALDVLHWVSGDGLALAQFGTRGSYYRPERANPTPTLAFIDAARGRVLDTLAFERVYTPRVEGLSPSTGVRDWDAIVLRDGRMRAIVRMNDWVIWTQGEEPRVLANPYAPAARGRLLLAPNGRHALWAANLGASGVICETPRRDEATPCPPPTPVEGVLAALHDLDTGAVVWTLRARATEMSHPNAAAISPDGRYALISLPDGPRSARVALVSMRDGEIVQSFPAADVNRRVGVGFARGSRIAWVTASHGVTVLYNLR